jgi:nicotinamidase-related amidase
MLLGDGRGEIEMSGERVEDIYNRARLGGRLTLGNNPAILVVDFCYAFTDVASVTGADLTSEVKATKQLLTAARDHGLPVFFTSQGFEAHCKDAAVWIQKSPALANMQVGTRWVEIDERLDVKDDEPVIVKKGVSALFATNIVSMLTAQRVDTVIVAGATTSGCVRATVVDLLQYGFPTLVPRECVGDRAQGPHEASLFDMQAKYADVVGLDEALAYIDSVAALMPVGS